MISTRTVKTKSKQVKTKGKIIHTSTQINTVGS